MRILVDRSEYGTDSTVGDLFVDGVWECVVMEPGANEPEYPAIPEGTYNVLITPSPRFGRPLPLVINVPGRDGIRFHPGNKPEQTLGCLMTGENVMHVAGVPFVTHSARAFDRLFEKMDAAIKRGEDVILEVVK